MVVTLSRNSSGTPEKEIKLPRDGLRLFRCRSKSRQYRTWAITSGKKVILYFAAGSEIQAQNWMQAVRDGLWPPCFSFQVLTACSYEVSLIDDDNTFMAGLLGVYGRFVLSSEDVISLMHPHWGSTSLEISLDNIVDVIFVREVDLFPAGVFSITLKKVEGSNVKALQFFCNKAKDAMQWILSKLYLRRQSFSLNGIENTKEKEVISSFSDNPISSQNNHYESLNNEAISIKKQLASPQTNYKNIIDPIMDINLQPEYENIHSLQMKNFQKENKHSTFDKEINKLKDSSLENASEETLLIGQSRNDYFYNFSSDFKSMDKNTMSNIASQDNIYENIINKTPSCGIESFKILNAAGDLNNLSTNLDSVDSSISKIPIRDESVVYAVVNKTRDKKIDNLKVNSNFMTKTLVEHKHDSQSNYFEESSSLKTVNNAQFEGPVSSNTLVNIFSVDEKYDKSKTKTTDSSGIVKHESEIYNGHTYSAINKTISEDLNTQTKSVQYSTLCGDSLNSQTNFTKNNHYLPNLPSSFLDTSMNSLNPNNKTRGSSSSSEEDNESLFSLVSEFDELKTCDQLYEDIIDRKGTIYEEIDEPENEGVPPPLSIPELPKRPTNLEIPESLRLQKLSKNIKYTLEVMGDTQSQKEFRHPNFVKKIKDVNRIMHLSPKQECAKQPLTVESKSIRDTKNKPLLSRNGTNMQH